MRMQDLDDWLPLDCPLINGHVNVTARETFKANLEVTAYRRPLWLFWSPWAWTAVERRVFRDAGFELGGGYRPTEMLRKDIILESKKTC